MDYQKAYYFTDRNGARGFPVFSGGNFGREQELREVVSQDERLRSMFGTPILDSAGLEKLQRKVEEYRNIDFQGWAFNQIDTSTPSRTKHWLDKLPELFEPKLEAIKEETDIQKRVAMISIFGPETMDDMRLIYDINQKQKTLSHLPLYIYNQNSLNDVHSFVDKRPLFPTVQNRSLFNLGAIFNPNENTVFEPGVDNYKMAFKSVFGDDPNSSKMQEGKAIGLGLGRFFG